MSTRTSRRNKALEKFVKNIAAKEIVNAKARADKHEHGLWLAAMRPHECLALANEGLGTYEGWNLLAFRVNVGAHVAVKYFVDHADHRTGPKLLMIEALRHLEQVHKKFLKHDRISLSNIEYRSIGHALMVIDAMQAQVTPALWTAACLHIEALCGVSA